MLTPQIDMNKDRGLGWSLGFGTQDDENGRAIWQWGDYGVFRNYVIAYPRGEDRGGVSDEHHNGLSICSHLVASTIAVTRRDAAT